MNPTQQKKQVGGRSGTISISWGRWGGFYRYRSRGEYLSTIRICCGWLAITYIGGIEIDDLMQGYGEAGEQERLRAGVAEETRRLRERAFEPSVEREKRFTADRLGALLENKDPDEAVSGKRYR